MSTLDDADDEAFLLGVEAAEAAALASKRRRLSSSPTTPPTIAEGSYMAALKGSHSSTWKEQKASRTLAPAPVARGACFKCGDSGHWARECPLSATAAASVGGGGGGGGGGFVGGGGGDVEAGGAVEEKVCPCGAGRCVVFTSTTPRNPGRKFYRCPLRDNGGCNFFEWCDTPSRGLTNTQSITIYQSDSLVADMLCPCGAGTCLILTTKTGKNVGRQFYGCPANQGGGSCGFFKWCDDQQLWTAAPLQASPQYQVDVNSSSHNYSRRSSSSCFKCGQENHWAKDCPKQSLDPSDKGGITITPATSSGTCCKCGKAGHWSRDCPTLHCGAGAVSSQIKSSSLSSWKNL